MPRTLYSYHFRREMPLLTDEEYASIEVLISKRPEHVMAYRRKHNCSLDEARARSLPEALDLYESLTGCWLEHPDMLWHVRLSDYGRPCPECGKPFRTPRAKLCAECGFTLPPGEVAGPAGLIQEKTE